MVTDSPKFDLGADDFTIECWFNPTSLRSENHNGWTPIINHHRTGNNSDCAFDFSHYNNKSIACYIFSGSNYISLTKNDILTYGEWHHLAVKWFSFNWISQWTNFCGKINRNKSGKYLISSIESR